MTRHKKKKERFSYYTRSLTKLVPRSFYCDCKVSVKRKIASRSTKERERTNSCSFTLKDNIAFVIDRNSELESRARFNFVSRGFFSLCLLVTHVRRISAGGGEMILSPFYPYIRGSPQTSRGIDPSPKQAVTHTNHTQTVQSLFSFRLSICLSLALGSMFSDFNFDKIQIYKKYCRI